MQGKDALGRPGLQVGNPTADNPAARMRAELAKAAVRGAPLRRHCCAQKSITNTSSSTGPTRLPKARCSG